MSVDSTCCEEQNDPWNENKKSDRIGLLFATDFLVGCTLNVQVGALLSGVAASKTISLASSSGGAVANPSGFVACRTDKRASKSCTACNIDVACA